EDQAVLVTHKQFLVEQDVLKEWERNTSKLSQVITGARSELSSLPSSYEADEASPNKSLLAEAQTLLSNRISMALQKVEEIQQLISESSEDWRRYLEYVREWEAKFEAHTKKYEEVKQQATEHEALLKQIAEIEARISSLKETVAERKADLESHGKPEEE